MMLVLPDPHFSIISSTWELYSAVFQTFSCHPRVLTRTILVFGEQKDMPSPVLFPIQVPIELPQIVFPTRGQQLDVRTSFVREEPPGLRCLTMIWAIYAVEDVSIHLDIQTVNFDKCGASSILPGCKLILRRRLVQGILSSAITSISFAAVVCEADDPRSVNTTCAAESSFTMSPRNMSRPVYFWCFGSNSAFLR